MSETGAHQEARASIWRVLALLLAVALSSSAALLAKYALDSFSPLTMTAVRVWIAALVMLPIAIFTVPGGLHWRGFLRALPMSLCYGLNATCFGIGINFTTAIASQLIYLLVPVLALIGARIFFREPLTATKVIGTALGIGGVVVVLLGSLEGSLGNSLGTLTGNALILAAAVAWASFSLLAQRQSQSQHPLELSCYALLTCACIMPLVVLPDLLRHQAIHASVTWLALLSAIGLALLVSVGRDAAFQWGIHGSSAFVAGALGFAGPFLTTAYAIPLLGEQLSVNLLISGALIIVGLFFAVILPAQQQRRLQTAARAKSVISVPLLDDTSAAAKTGAALPLQPDRREHL